MGYLQLDTWNQSCLDYFSEGRINTFGLTAYWMAINDAFEHWDRDQMKERLRTTQQKTTKKSNHGSHFPPVNYFHRERQQAYDKYHWMAPTTQFTLPALKRH